MRCSVFKMSCFGGSSVIPDTQTSPPEPLPTRLRRMRLGLAIQMWLSARPARRGGAWPLVAVRRARPRSRRRMRQAPPSPMGCSTRTRRSLDGPHRRCSALVADEHARPIARSRTGIRDDTNASPQSSTRPSSTPTIPQIAFSLAASLSDQIDTHTCSNAAGRPRGDATG